MAVVPLRTRLASNGPPIRTVAKPETGAAPPSKPPVRITIDDDGLATLDFGGITDAAAPSRRTEPDDEFDRNLAEDMDPNAMGALAGWLIERVEADIEDRSEWEKTANRVADYLGIKLNEPVSTAATDGTVCQAVSTCMLEAAVKMWSTAYAELLPTDGPVKVKRQDPVPATGAPPEVGHNGGPALLDDPEPGQDPVNSSDAAGDDLAQSLEEDFNWYLTSKDKGYYPDFSKMLMHRYLIGIAFRDVYRCPLKRMPISRWVMAQDLIIQGDPAHLEDAGRVTVRKAVSQATMRRLMKSGEYRDVPLVAPTNRNSETEIVIGETQGVQPMPMLPTDFEHEVYEVCCELGSGTNYDLLGSLGELDVDERGDDPGYPLPYRVSIDVDSRTILAIRRNWKKGDADHRVRRRFVKYGFIPAFGFYDWGLIHLVGNPTLAATMLQRSSVDSAMYANFPAWMQAQGPGSRAENTVYRPAPGEIMKVAVTGGAKLSDTIQPWPYKDPSPAALELVQKFEGDVKRLTGLIDLPVGEGRLGNTPVGTIMSYIESVSMVPGAVHKADHTSQAEEFELLRELIAEEPEVLWRGNRSPARKWQVMEEVLSPDLSPKADPNVPSQIHRLAKVQGLISLAGQPQFAQSPDGPVANQRAIYKKAVEVLVGEDAAEYELPPVPPSQAPPPPDPRVVAAQIKAQSQSQSDQIKAQVETKKEQSRMAELAVEAQSKEADRQAANAREMVKVAAVHTKVGADVVSSAIGHAHDAAMQGQQHAHDAASQQADHTQATQQQLTAPLIAPADGGSKDGG